MNKYIQYKSGFDKIMDILQHNKIAWNNYVDKKDRWTLPVTDQEIINAKEGKWKIVLTCSILFVEYVLPVWKECYRVLKPGGVLMTGLINPISLVLVVRHLRQDLRFLTRLIEETNCEGQLFQLDENSLELIYKQPYSDIGSLPDVKLEELKKNNEALAFGHSLSDQIGGQLDAGFILTNMYEDNWGGQNKMDEFFNAFIATRAVKAEDA